MTKEFIVDKTKLKIMKYKLDTLKKNKRKKCLVPKIFKLTPDIDNKFKYIQYITAKPSLFEKIKLIIQMKKSQNAIFFEKEHQNINIEN